MLDDSLAVYRDIENIIRSYGAVSLEDMKSVRLMNRIDTKYLVRVLDIKRLLAESAGDYSVQEVDGERNIAYHTIYYDTSDYKMYIAHQNGKKTREKIRMRTYVSSGLSFLEIKNKNNRGRTDKKRIKVDVNSDYMHTEETRRFLAKHAWFSPDELVPHLENRFNRITLVNRGMTERLTIDTGLCFHNYTNDRNDSLAGIAVVELKRDGRTLSPLHDLFIRMHIHTM
ncbi:MAG: polyphosphate polymerase domain-containing protein, partial [Proteobacteria bacterium]|nr:polyphosphate polymerase domain-containing protein [Pseudomonadota bacterium]